MRGQLVVEDMCQLVVVHAAARVADRHFDIVLGLRCMDVDRPLGGELAGIVGQGVQHEEGEYAVGLDHGASGFHAETDTFHLETLLAACHHVEERLQGETLDAQVQLSLPQLYPLGQHLVVGLYLLGQLADVLLVALSADSVDHAVDERQQAVDQRYLGTLFGMSAFALLDMSATEGQLLTALLQFLFQRILRGAPTVQAQEEPEQEHQ